MLRAHLGLVVGDRGIVDVDVLVLHRDAFEALLERLDVCHVWYVRYSRMNGTWTPSEWCSPASRWLVVLGVADLSKDGN